MEFFILIVVSVYPLWVHVHHPRRAKTVSFNALGIIQRVAQRPDTRQRRDERSLEVDETISEVVDWDWAGSRNCVYVDDLKALIDG